MTSTDVIYQRRVAAITHAGEIGNIAETARIFGVARQTVHGWIDLARRYGLSALVPKGRRRPTQPNEMAAHEVEAILAEAIARPTLGAGRLLEHLTERGIDRSKSGVHKVLTRHGLGTRAARVKVLAAVTAATSGVISREVEPRGFCHFAAAAGDLVGLDAFYVGRLKGIGPVWQLTAVDTHTRWAIAELYIGKLTSTQTVDFLDLVVERLAAIDVELCGIVTDNGPQFISQQFTGHVTALGVDHTRTPPRSPDYNAVCERFQGTALEEFYRPTFHRGHISDVGLLNRQLQGWLERYNTRRRNRGAYMHGRTPLQVLQSSPRDELSPRPVASTH
ncbi:MAG: DDE-type integrase/transposase/recombinase [Thermocrispum sp.]